MPDISVILVNFNGQAFIEKSLRSIEEEAKAVSLEIIVVDNASSDQSCELIQTHFPDIKLIRNIENKGFSKANNQGFGLSKGKFVLFLNTDAILKPGALKSLVNCFMDNPGIGILGPVLMEENGVFQVSYGGRRSYFSELGLKLFFNGIKRKTIPSLKSLKSVHWVSGACLFIRRDVFLQSGGFDEKFFLYYEDIDLCFRVKNKGWMVALYPDVQVFHEQGSSSSSLRNDCRYYYRKSHIYFYKKHNSKLSQNLLWFTIKIEFIIQSFFGYLKNPENIQLRKKHFDLLKRESWKK